MADRPFFTHTIAQLEAAFEERAEEPAFLGVLADELAHRTKDRAARLLERVRDAQARFSIAPAASGPATPAAAASPPKAAVSPSAPPRAAPAPTLTTAGAAPPPTVPMTDRLRPAPIATPMPPQTNAPTAVLGAWTALEVLSPQTFLKPQQLAVGGDARMVVDLHRGLPWERGEKGPPQKKLFYHVLLGTLDAGNAFAALLDRFADTRAERPSVRGEAILAAVVVDKAGRLAGEPAVAVSSFAWGLPVALQEDLTALSNWSGVAEGLEQNLDERLRRTDEDGEDRPLDTATIESAFTWLVQTLGVPTEFVTPPRYAIRAYEYFKASEPPEPLLLNSFYLGDLARARAAFNDGKAPHALRLYVGADKPTVRKDLLEDSAALEEAVAPRALPLARWPGSGRHPLVLLQQAAVNLAQTDAKSTGLLGVNGPPGTGKTTLLRDIVAALITQRAEAMCRFDDPSKAFSHSNDKLKAGAGWLHLYSLDPTLKGYEVLVASSNNKAVENVSAELPGKQAVADDANLSYFQPLSDALLERSTWGLIAAVLGNAANRGKFRKTFWWDKEVGMSTYLLEADGTPQWVEETAADGSKHQHRPRIVEACQAPDGSAQALERWAKARTRFQRCHAAARKTMEELDAIRRSVQAIAGLTQQAAAADNATQAAAAAAKAAKTLFEQSLAALGASEPGWRIATDRLARHDVQKPSFFARLFRWGEAKTWVANRIPLAAQLRQLATTREQQQATLARHESEWKSAEVAARRRGAEAEAAHVARASAQQVIATARTRLGHHLVDAQFFARAHTDKHQAVPWCDATAQRTRDDLFVAAMDLHKAFIDGAAKPIRHNLGALMNAMGPSGGAMSGPKARMLPDVWSTLFLVVPVVSTTFASVERMMGALPPESLGWLLIDEAGQAVPQAAVGAILRVRRAVIVAIPSKSSPWFRCPTASRRPFAADSALIQTTSMRQRHPLKP